MRLRCDYCGDALPGVRSRSAALATPDLQRLGFSAEKIVCPECATDRTNGAKEER